MTTKFHLTHSQNEWFNSKATELAVGGASGGGKSHFLRIASILWAIEIPNLQINLFRRLTTDLHANHVQGNTGFPVLLADYIESGHCKYHITHNQFKFWNGSQISLNHLQQEKDLYSHQGRDINVLMIDEHTHFTESMYRFLRSRVRMANTQDLPEKYKDCFPRIVCSTNPGGVGHNFVKKTFVDPEVPKTTWQTPSEEGGMKRAYYPALLTDNPYLIKNDPHYVDRLKGLGNPEMIRAFLMGDWSILAGSMFDDVFDRSKHVLSKGWMTIGTESKQRWKYNRCFDWGWSRPFSVLWCVELTEDYQGSWGAGNKKRTFKKGSIIVFDEMYGWTGNPNEGVRWSPSQIAEAIRDKESRMPVPIMPGPADRSIYDGDTNIAGDMANLGIHWTPSDKSSGSRIRGWQKLREYFQSALQQPPEAPGLYILETCAQLLRTMMLCERDKGRPDDLDTNSEDHLLDALRYRILEIPKTMKTTKVIGF